jgi:hypothetical protein
MVAIFVCSWHNDMSLVGTVLLISPQQQAERISSWLSLALASSTRWAPRFGKRMTALVRSIRIVPFRTNRPGNWLV